MTIPCEHTDPLNLQILSIAEDQVEGFHQYPFRVIAEKSGIAEETVIERLLAMKRAAVVRRVRQTLLATKLAPGALVAWKLPVERQDAAFAFLTENDPFTGHVVLRRAESRSPGHDYHLWTTLKVPQGKSVADHCTVLKQIIGAEDFVLLPTKGVFALGVGHIRRRDLKPGDKREEVPYMHHSIPVEVSAEEWDVLLSLKEELKDAEFVTCPWIGRAEKLGMTVEDYCRIAKALDEKRVIGRFATFLEHVKPSAAGNVVTNHNGLFHWAVPEGMEKRAGEEVGRHICMTHCYWRTGGAKFGGAQIMGVVHGLDRDTVLAHKAAIDSHLAEQGIPLLHTAVFWGVRSEIKPSEISPVLYEEWMNRYRQG